MSEDIILWVILLSLLGLSVFTVVSIYQSNTTTNTNDNKRVGSSADEMSGPVPPPPLPEKPAPPIVRASTQAQVPASTSTSTNTSSNTNTNTSTSTFNLNNHISALAQKAGIQDTIISYEPPALPATSHPAGPFDQTENASLVDNNNTISTASPPTVVTPPANAPPPVTTVPLTLAATNNIKKGFVAGNSDSTAAAKMASLRVDWYYTWGSTPSQPAPNGVPFTPMFWNVSKASPACSLTSCTTLTSTLKLPMLGATPPPGDDGVLLGYNEPDGVNASAQGNMRVGDAVTFWPLLSGTNRRLGSPVMYGSLTHPTQNNNNVPPPAGYTPSMGAVSYTINISNNTTPNNVTLTPGSWDAGGNNISGVWLDNFLYQVYQYNQGQQDIRNRVRYPDFIAVHWYGPPNARSFLNYLSMINAKYNLPIWVTEYSCADWGATCCSAMPAYSRLTYSNITQGTTHTAGIDWSYPTSSASDATNTNATAQFMIQTVAGMNQMPFVERYSWKERFYLMPPGSSVPTGQPAANYSIEAPSNPDVMGQSALFASFQHFPSALPPLTPLGQLYASL